MNPRKFSPRLTHILKVACRWPNCQQMTEVNSMTLCTILHLKLLIILSDSGKETKRINKLCTFEYHDNWKTITNVNY